MGSADLLVGVAASFSTSWVRHRGFSTFSPTWSSSAPPVVSRTPRRLRRRGNRR